MVSKKQQVETKNNGLWTWHSFAVLCAISVGGAVLLAIAMYLVTPLINPDYPQNLLYEGTFQIIGLGVVAAPAVYLFTSIKENWWDKLSSSSRTRTIVSVSILGILIYIFVLPTGGWWIGDGKVNVYPLNSSDDEVRNMTVEIEVKDGWWRQREYHIQNLNWDDREDSYVNCTISSSNNICTSSREGAWKVEIVEVPDAPDYSTD